MLQGRVNMRNEKMMEKDKNFYIPVISVYPPLRNRQLYSVKRIITILTFSISEHKESL